MKNQNIKVLLACTKSITYNLFLKDLAKELNKKYHLSILTSDKVNLLDKNINSFNIDLPKNIFEYMNIFSLCIKIIKANIQLYNFKDHYLFIHTPNISFFIRFFIFFKFKKIVYFVHGFRFHKKGNFLLNKFFYFLEKILSYKTNNYIAINNEDYNIINNNLQKPCIKISGVGISEKFFIKNKKYKKKEKFCIGVIGAYRKNKGYLKLINLAKNLDNTFLIDCYGYDNKGKYLEKINKFKIQNIKLNDFTDEIYSKIDSFDILLHLSFREGLPISVLQCLSRGVPVLGHNIRGMNDLIKDNYNGYLFEFNEEQKFLQKIKHLSIDNEHLQNLINNSIKCVDQLYTTKYINKKIINYFEEIFNEDYI